MRIDLPQCGFHYCRFQFDGNCTSKSKHKNCEYRYLNEQPDRKKGKWIELTNTNHTYICSVCGRMLVNISEGKNNVAKSYPFCHCGADMRGEHDE